MQGYGDPFCRRPFPWDKIDEVDSDGRIRERYQNMISLRNMSKAFSIGEYECVYKIGRVYAFIRAYHDEKYLVIANMGTGDEVARVDVARYGIKKMTCITHDAETKEAEDGIYYIDMPRFWLKAYRVDK
jgi:alpha-glucosidase